MTNRREGWFFTAPAVIFLFSLALFPLIFSIVLSLYNVQGGQFGSFVGLQNYIEGLRDVRFWASLGRTGYFTTIAVGIQFLLGLALALLVMRLSETFRRIYVTLLFVPVLIAPVVAGFMFKILLDGTVGYVNYITVLLGGQTLAWTSNPSLVLYSALIADTWQWTPFIMLILVAGLVVVPKEPIESSLVYGASSWQRFRSIVFPYIKPMVTIALLLRMLDCFTKLYDTVFVMTGGGPGTASEVTNVYLTVTGFHFFRTGYTAALAYFLFIIIMILVNVFLKIMQRKPKEANKNAEKTGSLKRVMKWIRRQ